jgi:hypothetical protein
MGEIFLLILVGQNPKVFVHRRLRYELSRSRRAQPGVRSLRTCNQPPQEDMIECST